jgi:NAD(P)H-hydrate epimerase
LLGAATDARNQYQANIILKSASTVIATLGSEPEAASRWISPTGNPGMATAGSGDVLSGILGALAAQTKAQNLPLWHAATLGVYLHGLAGDKAAEHRTPYAMRASDIIRHLPQAFHALLETELKSH